MVDMRRKCTCTGLSEEDTCEVCAELKRRHRQTHCNQPDRDVPGIKCGYPLPCPHHTAIMEVGEEAAVITIPKHGSAARRGIKRLKQVVRALQGKRRTYRKPTVGLVGGGPFSMKDFYEMQGTGE